MQDILNFYRNDHGGTTEEMVADLVNCYQNKNATNAKRLVTSCIELLSNNGCRFKIESLEVEHSKGYTFTTPTRKECEIEAIDWLARSLMKERPLLF